MQQTSPGGDNSNLSQTKRGPPIHPSCLCAKAYHAVLAFSMRPATIAAPGPGPVRHLHVLWLFVYAAAIVACGLCIGHCCMWSMHAQAGVRLLSLCWDDCDAQLLGCMYWGQPICTSLNALFLLLGKQQLGAYGALRCQAPNVEDCPCPFTDHTHACIYSHALEHSHAHAHTCTHLQGFQAASCLRAAGRKAGAVPVQKRCRRPTCYEAWSGGAVSRHGSTALEGAPSVSLRLLLTIAPSAGLGAGDTR